MGGWGGGGGDGKYGPVKTVFSQNFLVIARGEWKEGDNQRLITFWLDIYT